MPVGRGGPEGARGRPKGLRWLLLALVLGFAAPASAQIYTWRDTNGTLVLSNRPRQGAPLRSDPLPQTESPRATSLVAAERSRVYDDLISEHALLNGVRTDLVRAVIQVESAFNPYAQSPKGALGLMQLMPATVQQFGVINPFNPIENIRAGVAYLRRLLDRYENDEKLALAAYNAGPSAVDHHGQSIPPYRETRDYVSKIHRIAGRSSPEPRETQIYKTIEIIDGRPVARYSDKKPVTADQDIAR